MPKKRLLTNYFPEPRFQARMLGFMIGGTLLHVGVASAIVFYFIRQNYALFVQYAALDPEITALLYRELSTLISILAVNSVFFVTGMTVLGIHFSHRIAGPMYALKRTLRSHLAGKPVTLHFRKTDEFQDLATAFNEFLAQRGEIPAKGNASTRG